MLDLNQLVEVANARFSDGRVLALVCIAVDRIHAPLRYEYGAERDGGFPHRYDALRPSDVVEVVPFKERASRFVRSAVTHRLFQP